MAQLARSDQRDERQHSKPKAEVRSTAVEFTPMTRCCRSTKPRWRSGLEWKADIAPYRHRISTILVTAYPDDVDHARARNHGVVCYLRKPFDEKHLIRCLGAALQSCGPADENS